MAPPAAFDPDGGLAPPLTLGYKVDQGDRHLEERRGHAGDAVEVRFRLGTDDLVAPESSKTGLLGLRAAETWLLSPI